jgi:putative transposase
MIDRSHELPLSRQAALLRLSRSRLYYEPQPVPQAELAIMRRIDVLHLDYPFAGSRMLRDLLRGEGVDIGREMVRTMMRRMGIEALYRRPNTSKRCPGHKIYPYLLRGLAVERANQVWAMDITYIPMARGFVYLAAVVDWFSRRVLAWRVSITMEVDFCLEAVGECQASCRMAYVMVFVYATPLFRVFDWLWSKAAWTTASRSGLSVTAAIGVQFRV